MSTAREALGLIFALLVGCHGRATQTSASQQLAASEAPWPWHWSRVEALGSPPGIRQGHAAVEVGQRVYVIGGCLQEISCYSDVFFFDTDSLTWSQVAVAGDVPEPRGGHSATVIGHEVIVYGGANSEATFGDVYVLDLVKLRWQRLIAAVPGGGGGVGPGKRTGHASATGAHGEIFVFGGYAADGKFLNDLWVLSRVGDSGATWSRLEPSGALPAAREAHSLTYIDGKLILFGGYTSAGVTANDAHAYDVETQRWMLLQVAGPVPSPRQAHAAVRHGRALVIAGGCDVAVARPACFADVWSLNLAAMRWEQRSSDTTLWFPREGHSATFVRGKMFTFGGCDLSSSCYNDLTVLDTQDPCPNACGSHGECVGAAFCRCTSFGFTGHDCMQPLVCPLDCGVHGACSQDGQCVCENGWAGPGCAWELPCPGAETKCNGRGLCLTSGVCQCIAGYAGPACDVLTSSCPRGCSGNGDCSADGRCTCHAGWGGEACDAPFPLSLAGTSPLRKIKPQHSKGVALLDPFARAHHASERASHEHAAPIIEDFGVQRLNKNGRSGFQATCPDACNFRGLCEAGVCYCQPGFHGETCDQRQVSTRGTISLVMGVGIALACFGVSFLVMMIPVHLNAKHKQHAESQAGYNI